VDGGRDVAVPYRWVSASGDVVLLSTFPEHVTVMEAVEEEKKIEA
jgi:sporulation protein YlmC with PRC-barrel domain